MDTVNRSEMRLNSGDGTDVLDDYQLVPYLPSLRTGGQTKTVLIKINAHFLFTTSI